MAGIPMVHHYQREAVSLAPHLRVENGLQGRTYVRIREQEIRPLQFQPRTANHRDNGYGDHLHSGVVVVALVFLLISRV